MCRLPIQAMEHKQAKHSTIASASASASASSIKKNVIIIIIGNCCNLHIKCFRDLDSGSTVTFLLRSPATFDDDQSIQKHVKSGKARLIKDDGLVLADVMNVWAAASLDRSVDVVIFTVGFNEHH